MDSWKFSEILTTLRDYQALLNQTSVVLITSAGILAFKNRRLKGRVSEFLLSGTSLVLGILSILAGFSFRSKLIEIIPNLGLKEKPSSVTDPCLKWLTLAQIGLISLGAILLIIAATRTPRDKS